MWQAAGAAGHVMTMIQSLGDVQAIDLKALKTVRGPNGELDLVEAWLNPDDLEDRATNRQVILDATSADGFDWKLVGRHFDIPADWLQRFFTDWTNQDAIALACADAVRLAGPETSIHAFAGFADDCQTQVENLPNGEIAIVICDDVSVTQPMVTTNIDM